MARADTAKLIASLELKDAFSGTAAKFNKAMAGMDASLSKTEGRAYKAGQQIGTGIKNAAKIAAVGVGLVASQVALGLQSLVKLEEAQAQTAAVLKSTGGAAGVTGAQVTALAEKFEGLNATVGDEFIRAGENMLLTFTEIRGKAFEPALAAVLDMNTAMGKGPEGLTTTAILVGKALNDPTKGLTALRKVGVTFTEAQLEQVKALQASGDMMGAQRIVLAELNKEFGGSFLAQGGTTAGKVAKFTDSIDDLQRSLASALLPTIGKVADRLSEFLANPAVVKNIGDLGTKINGLFSDANIKQGADVIKGVFTTIQSLLPAIQTGAEVTSKVITTAVSAFKSLPPEIQALAVAGLAVNKLTGGLVTNIAGGLISAVISSFKGLMNVNAAVVNVNGAVGAGGLPVTPAGGSSWASLFSLIVPAAALAIGTDLATRETNKQFAEAGRPADFQNPLNSVLPFGIDANIHNLLEVIKQAQKGPIVRPIEDRSQDAIEKLRGAITTETLSVNVENADAIATAAIAAFKAPDAKAGRAAITADQIARGVAVGAGPSKSLDPRFRFLAGGHAGAKDAAVVEALATGFERADSKKSPVWRSLPDLKRAIEVSARDQKQLLKAGDTKNAALIGADVDRMKAELGRRTDAAATKTANAATTAGALTAAAIREQDLTHHVTVTSPPIYIDGRLFTASINRTTSTASQYGNQRPI